MNTAIITGAAGGIGTAICSAFRQEGYRVVALDRLDCHSIADIWIDIELERYCVDSGYKMELDKQLLEAVGSSALSVLVNNAAVQILGDSSVLTTENWQATLSVNLIAPFLLSQALLEALESSKGSIVNIASIHASLTKPGFVCYATSKAALVGLTRSMAVDVGQRVRVNAICPAAISTPMLSASFDSNSEALDELLALHPIGRIGQPEEVAAVTLFLASEKADFLNGTILGVDGGIASRLHDPV